MGLKDTLADFGDFLDGKEMTGRQAGIVIALWMGFTAVFGLIVFFFTFVIMGY